jgi:5-methyltetrahydropteroyltriglutamate--homocysteine methyltransferase
MIFPASVAGSLPKPSWLAEPNKLWPQWRLAGDDLAQAKLDAALLAIKMQEDAGIDIVCDGEMSRQHFVHGFLEFVDGIDFANKVEMGIRADRYKAMVPQVRGELTLKGRAHEKETRHARAHTKKQLKVTLPGPMTISDTIADRFYGDKVKMAFAFAGLLNKEARALEQDGVDVIQFDEPAFNVFMDDVTDWGITALERAIEGLSCKTCVHICYGYGIKANIDWKNSLGEEWRQYETIFPALAGSKIGQVSLECANSNVPMSLMGLLGGKDVLVGVIDVATDTVETPEQIAKLIGKVSEVVPKEHIVACTNCGMAPMRRELAEGKLRALGKGAAPAQNLRANATGKCASTNRGSDSGQDRRRRRDRQYRPRGRPGTQETGPGPNVHRAQRRQGARRARSGRQDGRCRIDRPRCAGNGATGCRKRVRGHRPQPRHG